MKKAYAALFILGFALAVSDPVWGGGYLYHATSRAAAAKIAKAGFSGRTMSLGARFGRGVYLSGAPATARAEKAGAEALVRVRKGGGFERRVLDLSRPDLEQLRALSGTASLRGAVKRGVIGPQAAHRIGQNAAEKGRIVRYRSARSPGGINFFVPKSLYNKCPGLVRTSGSRMIDQGR
jgi:hypothetical protein